MSGKSGGEKKNSEKRPGKNRVVCPIGENLYFPKAIVNVITLAPYILIPSTDISMDHVYSALMIFWGRGESQ